MNSTLTLAVALAAATLALVPAEAQTALIVGSVRDQQGVPIEGAVVSGQTSNGTRAVVQTDPSGTFVLRAAGITALVITCRYCQTQRRAPDTGRPVVAIMRRYEALAEITPSLADLQNLPYTHVESTIALRPFTLLAASSAAYPGARVSDRGLSSSGSLLVDDGVPNYDVVADQSPYVFIPANYEQSALLEGAGDAYRYGDRAGGGIAVLDPFQPGSSPQIATLGSDTIARAQVGSDFASAIVGTSSNGQESRQRTDLFASWPLAMEQSLSLTAGTEQGRVYQPYASAFSGSFSFTKAAFEDPSLLNLSVSALTDRGNYTFALGDRPVFAVWSDSGVTAGVHTNGAVSGFGDVAFRSSAGSYNGQAVSYNSPPIAANLTQMRADAGFNINENDYRITGGLGAFWIHYDGGTYGISRPASVQLLEPSLQASLFPNGKWNVSVEGSGSFTLPSFFVQYQYAGGGAMPIAYQRNGIIGGALTYTDNSRVRITFQEAHETVMGASSGSVASAGLSATWQVAPTISLRAWTMHVTDTVPLYGAVPPYGGGAPTVNALWATYESGAALRLDVIYRRDLLDGAPFYHLDGALSGPIAERLRWYAGVESWNHHTFLDAGLRFAGR